MLPNPFPVPKFRHNTEKLFEDKILTDSDRKYVVQTMATVMMTYTQKPSLYQCSIVAKALISKYSFLKDCEGDGEVRYNVCACAHYVYNYMWMISLLFFFYATAFLEMVYILSNAKH